MALQPLPPDGTGTPSDPYDYGGGGNIQSCDGTFGVDTNYDTVSLTLIDSTAGGIATQKSPLVIVAIPVSGRTPPFVCYECTTPLCTIPRKTSLRVKHLFELDGFAVQGPALSFPASPWILTALTQRLTQLGTLSSPFVFHVYKIATAGIPGVEVGGYVAIPVSTTIPPDS